MSFRRDPSAPRLAPFLLALLLGLGSATVPAWSLDLGTLVREAPGALASRLSALLGLWAQDATTTPPPADATAATPGPEGSGGSSDAGVIIDPNGKP
ncbi:MAG: hypothetical protein ABJC13_24505 [Acidobacteriota bacterium]